jgi:hypothetical protein
MSASRYAFLQGTDTAVPPSPSYWVCPAVVDLPTAGTSIGDLALVLATNALYVFNGTTWTLSSGGGGGVPGTWTELASGIMAVPTGPSTILATFASAPPGTVIAPFVTVFSGPPTDVFQGDISSVPPPAQIIWALHVAGGTTTLRAVAGPASAGLASFLVYNVIP